MKERITKNEQETIYLAHQLGLLLKPGMIVLLDGDLASGKTTFAKGIGLALNIKETINSPSFTILKRYLTPENKLYHIDLYRIKGEGYDFDLEDYIYSDAITVIEWPFNVRSLLPQEYLLVKFEIIEEFKRKISFEAVGEAYEKVVYYL
ncbi:MAG: tRNA (adenosine(37)-N6)-threonylcarbamoyltransferase complex ATPase subunit type 1 TsaE [Acholeplasmataceae bacterium]|jgi:tRNA threonylcarbamoyladenosine biosynthesis protein TsaE|nr:tRNA (adenosine(37)-N6)-threonylcarbamoyltransferase complex ATPase subunit type 1 TsaE [Acholeplasmataceae bacterium]